MKLDKLRKKLEDKGYKRKETLKKEKSKLKIIGITGSRGKSTTAYIIHEYLKYLGYKSVLYSSIKIDSPKSTKKTDEACEVSVRDEQTLLNIIEEVEAYDADYLVLEVNDSILEKGFLKNVPFNVRVLTNLNPKHNLEHYTEEEYVNLKKSFFKDIEDECKCVIGLQDYGKELFKEFNSLNNYPKYTFSTNHIASVKGVEPNSLTCVLEELESTLNGLQMEFRLNDKDYRLKTKLVMSYNSLNILCALTTLFAIDVLEINKFSEFIKELKILGRSEIYEKEGRIILIDPQLSRMLQELYKYKQEGKIKQIKVVLGSIGSNYKTWDERFNKKRYLDSIKETRKYAMELLKKYADYAYLTECDNAGEDVEKICQELQSYLEELPSKIVTEREIAIKTAIEEAKKGDVIFISGRGNRKITCNSFSTMKLVKDSDVVKSVLRKVRWYE